MKFNEKHCKTRNIIERVNGVLKNRFRCIIGSRGLYYSPQKTTKIINSCCALHNICIFYKNNWDINVERNDDIIENYPDLQELIDEDDVDIRIRDEIARNIR